MVGICITPIILSISREYEDYSKNEKIPDPQSMSLGEFIKEYFNQG